MWDACGIRRPWARKPPGQRAERLETLASRPHPVHLRKCRGPYVRDLSVPYLALRSWAAKLYFDLHFLGAVGKAGFEPATAASRNLSDDRLRAASGGAALVTALHGPSRTSANEGTRGKTAG